ncbi:Hsp70 family protein [Blastococcus montanus]|uniref:Hsp70 family protein n=1 Tax=Blastococcus montanus TaxID=3144973 RepID=UPI003208DCFD
MHRGQRSLTRAAVPGSDQAPEDLPPGHAYGVGIDIGDETIAAAVCRPGRPATVLPLGGAFLAPAAVRVLPDGAVALADTSLPGPGEPVARHLMSRVGVPVPLLVAGRPVRAEDLVAAVVSVVQSLAQEQEGRRPSWTVLTVPPSWGAHRRAVLEEALAAAAVGPVALVSAAVAAVRGQAGADGGTFAVCDLGASTLDTAVVRVGPAGAEHVAPPPAPLPWGGRDVDDALLGLVLAALGPDSAGSTGGAGAAAALTGLRARCVAAKEALSTDTDVRLDLDLPAGAAVLRIVREDLEELVGDAVQHAVATVGHAVEAAGLRGADLDGVVLVGGAGRMPLVAELLSATLGRPLLVPGDPAPAAALGAAQLAGDLLEGTPVAGGSEGTADGATTVHETTADAEAAGDPGATTATAAGRTRASARRAPAARPPATRRSPTAPGGRQSGARAAVVAAALIALMLVPAALGAPEGQDGPDPSAAPAAAGFGDLSGWAGSWIGASRARDTEAPADDPDPATGAGGSSGSGMSLVAAGRAADEVRDDEPDGEPVATATDGRTGEASPSAAPRTSDAAGTGTSAPSGSAGTRGTPAPGSAPTGSTPPPSTPAPVDPPSAPPPSAPPPSAPPASAPPPSSSSAPPPSSPPPPPPSSTPPPTTTPTTDAPSATQDPPVTDGGGAPDAGAGQATEPPTGSAGGDATATEGAGG